MQITNDMMQELQSCAQAAEEGHKLALENYQKLHDALQEERTRIREARNKRETIDRIGEKNVNKLFKQQTADVQSLENTDAEVRNNINLLHQQQKEFSILLFGRTEAGKSTLMEILTHGDGKSIGRGAQRTTRDVRSYHWNGLKITDVPGICAFEGDEDDRLAIEAAKTADMIVFLITDDAPQAKEAERLAELRQYGKPVLGVMNVKMAINMSQNRKLVLRNLEKRLSDTARLDSIRKQFCDYGSSYGQDWEQIPFVYAHLRAAYLAQQCDDVGEANELYEASNFAKVEQFILETVRTNGRFWRTKTFIDSVAVPMYKSMNQFYIHSEENVRQAHIYYQKSNALGDWGENYWEYGNKCIDKLFDNIAQQIVNAAYAFAEENYENENAGRDWGRKFASLNIDMQCKHLLQDLDEECRDKLEELSDELSEELRFSSFSGNVNTNISMDEISDFKSLVNIGVGGLGAAAALGAISLGPIGWAALGIGALFSIFGDSREEKIREQTDKLRKAIIDETTKTYEKIYEEVQEYFRVEIYNKKIAGFIDQLNSLGNLLIDLANGQLNLARNLSNQYYDLNWTLVEEADHLVRSLLSANKVNYKLIDNEGKIIQDFLFNNKDNLVLGSYRIPGQEILLILPKDVRLSDATQKALESALGEQLRIIPVLKNSEWYKLRSTIEMVLDNSPIRIQLEHKDPIIYISLSDLLDANKARLSLVHQMTDKLIMDISEQ